MGVCVPEEYGGAGADFLSYILVLEQLSRADAGVGVTVAVHTSATTLPILAWGTEEQKSRFVPRLARGETIGAFALSEPDVGSDASNLRCAATRDGDEWVISGQKQWITNASSRTPCCSSRVRTRDAGSAGHLGLRARRGACAGDTRGGEARAQLSSTGDLVLDQARVSADRMLGAEGEGFAVAMSTLDGGRIGIAAQALGIAQAAYDVAASTPCNATPSASRSRATRPSSGSSSTWRWRSRPRACSRIEAAWRKEQGLPHAAAGAKAKLAARRRRGGRLRRPSRCSAATATRRSSPSSATTAMRRCTEIYEGTSEIQRLVIARSILGG